MFTPTDPGKQSALQEGTGHYNLLSASVRDRCSRIGRHEGSSMARQKSREDVFSLHSPLLLPTPPLLPLHAETLSSPLFFTLSTPSLVSQCHLETFLYTGRVQKGKKPEGDLSCDPAQGLEDSKRANDLPSMISYI